MESARGRERRAARRLRDEKLGGAALGGRAEARSVKSSAQSGLKIKLPAASGRLTEFRLSAPRQFPRKAAGPFNRVAYSAAHVVADPLATVDPRQDCAIDWDATI